MKKLVKISVIIAFILAVYIAHPKEMSVTTLEIPKGEHKELIEVIDDRAERIDVYYRKNKMPLEGYGKEFVKQADKNGIDWRLLPAISVKESSGGKHQIQGSFNSFGWGSGTVKFDSYEHAIEFISEKLGNGNHYKGKSTIDKLKAYNPPSIEPLYSNRVIDIMNKF